MSLRSRSSLMSVLGTPEKPNPPTSSVESDFMSLMASCAEGKILLIAGRADEVEKNRMTLPLRRPAKWNVRCIVRFVRSCPANATSCLWCRTVYYCANPDVSIAWKGIGRPDRTRNYKLSSTTDCGKGYNYRHNATWATPSFCFAIWSSPQELLGVHHAANCVWTPDALAVPTPGSRKRLTLGVDKNLTATRSETYRRKTVIGRGECRGKLFGADKGYIFHVSEVFVLIMLEFALVCVATTWTLGMKIPLV